jgi:hypothetical protein
VNTSAEAGAAVTSNTLLDGLAVNVPAGVDATSVAEVAAVRIDKSLNVATPPTAARALVAVPLLNVSAPTLAADAAS